jgi:predicted ArsR family transcriptional regulator
MQNTRQQILDFIRDNQMASAIEISRAFPMTSANARHHLSILEGQNLVEEVGQRLARGRGRPTKLFALTHRAMDHNIDLLVDALLKLILTNKNPEEQFAQLIPQLFGEEMDSKNQIQRLNQIIQRLNEMHYQARWEASPSGPRIIFGHCPYAPILSENPELCQMDQVMLAKQLKNPIEQIAKLERSPKGKIHCIFAMR